MSETMGSDPVEEILSEDSEDTSSTSEASTESRQNGATVKKRVTVGIPEELAERLRNCVFWTAGDVTMSGIATEGIKKVVKAIEEERNDGEKFPSRDQELKGGRPVK